MTPGCEGEQVMMQGGKTSGRKDMRKGSTR